MVDSIVARARDCRDSARRFYGWDATLHLLFTSSDPFPQRLLFRLEGFADLFTRPTWSNVLLLVAGVVLAPGRRTVTAALRILGRDHDPASALSTVSSTARRGRPGRWRAGC